MVDFIKSSANELMSVLVQEVVVFDSFESVKKLLDNKYRNQKKNIMNYFEDVDIDIEQDKKTNFMMVIWLKL